MRTTNRHLLAVAAVVALAGGVAAAAAPAVDRLSFAAASIKPSRESRPRVQAQGGGYVATGMSLRDLLIAVFLVHRTQLIGGPDWIDSARFDINARAAQPPPGGFFGIKPLIHSLLEDRFGLRTHPEVRELDAFVLERAHPDGPLPNGLQPTRSQCDGITLEERRAKTRDGWPPCSAMDIRNVPGAGTKGETTSMKVSAYTMDQFAAYLLAFVGGPVVNETGLNGRFDLEFSYVRPLPDAAPGDPLPDGPRLLVALEEQLGLHVAHRKATVPVVVIDAVSLPTAD